MTEKQRNYIRHLCETRNISQEAVRYVTQLGKDVDTLTKSEASHFIGLLLQCAPRSPRAPSTGNGVDVSTIPAGRYAVPGTDGKLRFVVVDKPESNPKWRGYTFVRVMASDEEHRLGMARPGHKYYGKSPELVQAIAANPKEAAIRYGHELGQCGICGRTLTDEESRARGIGPVCAEKVGWL